MNELAGVAKMFSDAEGDATDMRRGTASAKGNSPMLSAEEEAEMTRRTTRNGNVTAATNSTTPARSGLTGEQQTFLTRVKNTRKQGYMLTMEDADILIGIVEELRK